MSAILITDLSKKIGREVVFSSLNLEVLDGEFFALLAPEKKGKTTLARILFNFLKPSRGKVLIYDMDVTKESKTIKEGVALVPSEIMINENIKASTIFNRTLSGHNLSNKDELNHLLEYFDFDQRLRFSDMSEREQKIFSIINALIFKPRLIIMDDGTKNLTNEDKIKLFSYLRNLKQEDNLTLLMLSDDLPMAQSYFDRVAILKDGEVKDMEYVKDRISNDKVLVIKEPVNDLSDFERIGARIIRDELELHELYYNGSMVELTSVIYRLGLKNYSIFDSTLEDKVKALSYGPLPKREDSYNNLSEKTKRTYEEVNQVLVEPEDADQNTTLIETEKFSNEEIPFVDTDDKKDIFMTKPVIKENEEFPQDEFVNVSHMVESEMDEKTDDTILINDVKKELEDKE